MEDGLTIVGAQRGRGGHVLKQEARFDSVVGLFENSGMP